MSGWRILGDFLTAGGRRKPLDIGFTEIADIDEAIKKYKASQSEFVRKSIELIGYEWGEPGITDIHLGNTPVD